MRLISYNVRYFGHRLKGLASTTRAKVSIARSLSGLAQLPDLVAFQEVETRSMRSGLTRPAHPAETQLEAFLRHLGSELKKRGTAMPYRGFYFPAHTYRLGPVKLYTTGLAILVNAQTLDVLSNNGATPHPITHHRLERLKTLKQTRIAAHLHLEDAHGHKFHLFNTHLSLPTPWAKEFWEEKARMGYGPNQVAEAKAVSAFAAHVAKNEPYVVVGDFNSAPASPVYQHLTHEAKLIGAQAALQQIDPRAPNGFATAGFMRLRMHLDHVFGSPAVGFEDLTDTYSFGDERSPFHGLSDHVPLIARFGL